MSPVPVNDSLDGGQTNSGSWKFAGGVQALKHTKQSVGISHIEARTVIADEKCLRLLSGRAKFNARSAFVPRELPGISQKIVQHDPQEAFIRLRFKARRNDKIHG